MLNFLKRLLRGPGPQTPTGGAPGREGARRAEEHFDQLVASVKDYAIFRLDREGRVLTWNTGAERIKGYAAEEIIGQHFSRFYPPEAAASGWPAYELREAAATGRFEDEGWRLRKDGSRFWASVVITALRDESGDVRGFLKITRDLTERKRAEDKLRLSEERTRLLIEGVKDYAIFALDPQGRVATWNPGAERINGYKAPEIIGQHFSRFYPPEDVESGKPGRELEIALADGKYEEEGWRVRKDGSRFWASVVITPLLDEHGVLRGFGKVTRDLTERRQAEESARRLLLEEAARQAAEASAAEAQRAQREERRQREQLHTTLSSIGDAVIVTDTQGVVTFLNPVAQELTGWAPQEAAGRSLEDVFPIVNENTRQAAENPVAKVLREGVVVGLANHTVLLRKDGRETPIDDSAAPIRGEDGQVAGVVLVFRDVTEARRAVEARLHLAAIVESSDDAIISQTLDGKIASWNRGAERLYGYPADEVLGKSLAILVPPEHPDELPALIERLRRGESVDHYETLRLRKDGTRVHVSLTISPVRDADGRTVGASKVARDISAAKRQEAALRFLSGASKALAEVTDVASTLQKVAGLALPGFADWCAVDMLDADGALRRVAVAHKDPAKVQMALDLQRRYPPDPDAPVGVWNVLRTGKPELMPEIPESVLRSARSEEVTRVLLELGLKSYMGVPLTVRGRVIGVLTFIGAESGRRYGPDDLRLADDLAQRAAVAIENARLYSELKEADRRKDEFLAMLAHELRNPLAPIRNALEVLKAAGANPEALEQSRQIAERQLQHMVRLVDDLLDVSRIMQGRIELRKEPVALADVVATAVETARPMLDARDQHLDVSLPPEPLWLEADAMRLTQVIANLLHNAAKFSQHAGRIRLTAGRQNAEAVVSVRDEGAGIRADLLPHVFDLFVQGDNTLERSQGGLGIGLTVVRKLVELHGGTVAAFSKGAGQGSEFVVRLPALDRAPAAPSEPADANARGPEHRRVLVVDDNVDAAESMATLLRLWGHDVRLAHSGPDALRAAEGYHPEVVLLDIGLPGMNGYEVAPRLRQQENATPMFLVAMTGYGQDDDRRRAREVGFDHHLTKPVDPTMLQDLVARLPAGRRALEPRP
jgi:PAS domain S-box-containing protein